MFNNQLETSRCFIAINNRIASAATASKAIIAALALIILVFGILAGAELAMNPTSTGYCELKFPKWFGCVIANHENLAGGLIGAAGTLFAGWLAWTAVQTQMADARDRAEADRKEVEGLLEVDVENIAEVLGALWKVLEFVDQRDETLEMQDHHIDAIQTGIDFAADPAWIETTRSMIEVLGWRRRRDFASLLNSLSEIRKHYHSLRENVWETLYAVTQAADACEILFPETISHFEGRFRRGGKAMSRGDIVLMYADLPEEPDEAM